MNLDSDTTEQCGYKNDHDNEDIILPTDNGVSLPNTLSMNESSDNCDSVKSENEITLGNDTTGDIVPIGTQDSDYFHCGTNATDSNLWSFVARFDKISITSIKPNISEDELEYSDNLKNEGKEPDFDDIYGLVNLDKRPRGRQPNIRASLLQPHSQADTHILRLRNQHNWFIPVPAGPKIYRRDKLEIMRDIAG